MVGIVPNLKNIVPILEGRNMKMTLNVLLTLLIQAKRNNGKKRNGQLLVRFLSCIADDREIEIRRRFFDYDNKDKEFNKIDKLILDFLPDGKGYPYDRFTFRHFESCIGNPDRFGEYLSAMEDFCNDILDSKKLNSLKYTLLEIMRNDDTFESVIYGENIVSKQDFFDVITEPERVSIGALLIGLLYYVHKNPSEENTDNLHLKNLPKTTKCHIVCQEKRNLKMTLNVLLTLVIQAKHTRACSHKC